MSVDRRKVRRVVTLNLNFHVPNTSVHKKAAVCLSKFPNQFASQATDWRTVQSPLLSPSFPSTFLINILISSSNRCHSDHVISYLLPE